MTNQEIVSKLWNFCSILWHDGISYTEYVNELTYILFIKMAKETDNEDNIPQEYRWDTLISLPNSQELFQRYKELLSNVSIDGKGIVKEIYKDADTKIRRPDNLELLVTGIDKLDWFSAKEEGLGNLYEGLLQKNSIESKAGAGQYFTPRPLIDLMVRILDPKPDEECSDPACGTFGFMVSSFRYVYEKSNHHKKLNKKQIKFQTKKAFSGVELVPDTRRLALMNAYLHGMESEILLGDTLSPMGATLEQKDVFFANPPFGTVKPTREDFPSTTNNKQLNFLQHIYLSLKTHGKARAAVILPDPVLSDNEGEEIRKNLMENCTLHSVLHLPTGIFYAQGVKTSVLFFTRCKKKSKRNTKEVWFYDMRSKMPSFGKRTPLRDKHFEDFEIIYNTKKRNNIQNERFVSVSKKEIEEKNYSLDFGLKLNGNAMDEEELAEPEIVAENILDSLETATLHIRKILNELEKIDND